MIDDPKIWRITINYSRDSLSDLSRISRRFLRIESYETFVGKRSKRRTCLFFAHARVIQFLRHVRSDQIATRMSFGCLYHPKRAIGLSRDAPADSAYCVTRSIRIIHPAGRSNDSTIRYYRYQLPEANH